MADVPAALEAMRICMRMRFHDHAFVCYPFDGRTFELMTQRHYSSPDTMVTGKPETEADVDVYRPR